MTRTKTGEEQEPSRNGQDRAELEPPVGGDVTPESVAPEAPAEAQKTEERKPAAGRGRRAYALDALRGLAILAMVFSAVVPYGTLPAWMYHAQNPPPTHVFNPDLPGITWVDLVFPAFLFSMGAAIPLALSRRLASVPLHKILFGILWRGVLLAAFSYYRAHVDPNSISVETPTAHMWKLGLVGFVLVFVVWGRFPEKWPDWVQTALHLAGGAAAVLLFTQIHYHDGGNWGWSGPALRQWVERADIIILVLANVSVFGSLLWLLTRHSWWARLAPVGLMLGLKISASAPGWAKIVWNATPADWLYRMEFLKYLLIILPGTIVGDMLLSWMKAKHEEAPAWPWWRMALLGLLSFALSPAMVAGLLGRYVVISTLVALAMLGVLGLLVRRPATELERLLQRLYQWGGYWLVLGLFFEPYEGGIQKGNPTISYFFVTLGLSIFLLMAFTVVTDGFGRPRALQLLIENGQNPLVAYIGISNFIQPLLFLGLGAFGISFADLVRNLPPWEGAMLGAFTTLLLALFVSVCTKLKIIVRA